MRPSRTTTAPTGGFGAVRPTPFVASLNASARNFASSSPSTCAGESRCANADVTLRSSLRSGRATKRFELAREFVDVTEASIHRSEAHVRDLVELAQRAHHLL